MANLLPFIKLVSALNSTNFYLCEVRKAGGHFALFLLLFCNMSLYQLVKLPVLVQHYKEHRLLDQRIGLLDFLSMHYWGKDINDDDQQRDNELPFKEFHKETLQQFSTPGKVYSLKPGVYYCKSFFPVTGVAFLPDPKHSSLFRPPRSLQHAIG